MSESVDTVLSIIRDDLGACPDRNQVRVFQTPQDSWDFMPIGKTGDSGASMWWWIDTFLPNPSERRRIQRALFAVDMFAANLSRLTGKAPLSPRFKEGLKRQILQAMFPSPREVIVEAQRAPAARAKANLLRYVGAEQWRRRSWRGE